jgi:hypothetical protein
MIPMVSRILQVMDERGLINMPLRVNGLEVKVSPVAPLAMAQNMEEINNIMQFMQIANSLGQEGQIAVKTGDLIDYIGDKLGIPSAVRNSAAERGYLMQQAQNMQTEQNVTMAMAQQQQGGPIAA